MLNFRPTHLDRYFQRVQNFQRLSSSQVETFGQDAWVQAFTQLNIGLLQQFANEQYRRRCSIAGHVILCGWRTGNERCSWMLNLHFMQQNIAIFRDFDITSTRNKPIECMNIMGVWVIHLRYNNFCGYVHSRNLCSRLPIFLLYSSDFS